MERTCDSLDYLNIQEDSDVIKIISDDEPIFYSNIIVKINHYSFAQK
jgi:hypothetical protein